MVIAGEFWEDESQYRQQISSNGLAEHILLINRYIPNEEVGQLFSAADTLVAPYQSGTQSGAIKMAMGFGLRIIATNAAIGDLSIQDYPNLLTIQDNNPALLANTIKDSFRLPPVEPRQVPEDLTWGHLARVIAGLSADNPQK